jgi:hypothetical protein
MDKLNKSAGLSLIIGSSLMVVTMVLHPVGGNFDHLLRIISVAIISHCIAILSIPFISIGFYGILKRIGSTSFFSISGFAIAMTGLVAVLIAAALNGLALPFMVKAYEGASPELIESIQPILKYNSKLNHAFDYIYIGGTCLSMLFWSIAILKTKSFPLWIGYLGLTLSCSAIVMLFLGFYFVDLHGFRIFIFGGVAWNVAMGAFLLMTGKK